jgi:hypothetical protein
MVALTVSRRIQALFREGHSLRLRFAGKGELRRVGGSVNGFPDQDAQVFLPIAQWFAQQSGGIGDSGGDDSLIL